jgi:hypothetical protein
MTKEECLEIFDDALGLLANTFRAFEDALPPPVGVLKAHQGWVPRYRPPLLEHALLMKFARLVSVTSAMRQLVLSDHVHEQGILQRASDETGEDITFLAFGKQSGLRSIHRRYLDLFWREEFDGPVRPETYQPRHMVKRREIRDYIESQMPASARVAAPVSGMLYGVFSGFIHGASTHIFDLLDPETGRYRLLGIRDEWRLGYLSNAANYPLRALMAGVVVARALGEASVAEELVSQIDRLQERLDRDRE